MPESHALQRLRERHGIDLTEGDLAELAERLGSRCFNRNPLLFRYVGPGSRGMMLWQVNLREHVGETTWVTLVYNPMAQRITTVLPTPINSTTSQAREHIAAYHRQVRRRSRSVAQTNGFTLSRA